jgi:hypothetical protein
VPVNCQQFREDWALTATFTADGVSSIQPMAFLPAPRLYEAATLFNFGTCQQWVVQLSCITGPPDQLRITVHAGLVDQPAGFLDDIRLSFTDTPDIFPITISCPNVAAGCLGALADRVTVRIDQTVAARSQLTLPLV